MEIAKPKLTGFPARHPPRRPRGSNPLHLAILAKDAAEAAERCEQPRWLGEMDSMGRHPIELALKSGDPRIFEAIASAHDALRRSPSRKGWAGALRGANAALGQAAATGDPWHVRRLLRAGASAGGGSSDSLPPALAAAYFGRLANLRALLAAGASIDALDPRLNSALGLAAANGQAECVAELIAAGCEPDHANASGQTPLWMAAECGSIPCLRALILAGADLEKPARRGVTPLMAACGGADYGAEGLAVLLEAGADLSAVDQDGYSVLAHAVIQEREDRVRLLLDRGAKAGPGKNGAIAIASVAQDHGGAEFWERVHGSWQGARLMRRERRSLARSIKAPSREDSSKDASRKRL